MDVLICPGIHTRGVSAFDIYPFQVHAITVGITPDFLQLPSISSHVAYTRMRGETLRLIVEADLYHHLATVQQVAWLSGR